MSCDAELKELMLQVDKMVEDKKLEWQEKIKNAENKLNSTLQENFNLKTIIDDKNAEIANIKSRTKYKDNMTNVFDYDQEVLQLRLELSQIKKSYEKCYHKYAKKIKEIEKDKDELCKEKIDLLKEVNELRNCLKQSNDDRVHCQEQIRDLEIKRTNACVDRDSLNEQLKLMKNDFNFQLTSYVEAEKKYSLNLKELESKLNETKICLQHEIEENKTKLSDMMQHMKKAVEENQQLLMDNKSAKHMIIRLENELSKLSSENKMKDKTVCKMEQIMKTSEKTILEKNEVIRALQVNSTSKDYIAMVSKLENELIDVKSQLKLSKKSEKSSYADIQLLQKQLKEFQDSIIHEKNIRNQLESSLEQVSKTESEKSILIEKIQTMEKIIERKTSENENTISAMEKLKLENQKLHDQLTLDRDRISKNNANANALLDLQRKSEEGNFQTQKGQTTDNLVKERNYLLKFCEDKDMIIHRLQMENRILQEFISKLNYGLTGETAYYNSDPIMERCTSVSDIFCPLKETFTEYGPPIATDSKSLENTIHKNHQSSQSNSKTLPTEFRSNSSDSLSNFHFYHDNLQENINKSSEHFLNRLIRSESSNHQINDDEAICNIHPTLAAAKYFTEEREKTKKIEQMIDHHMNQLKKDTEYKRLTINQ